jgi:hypothetical protein
LLQPLATHRPATTAVAIVPWLRTFQSSAINGSCTTISKIQRFAVERVPSAQVKQLRGHDGQVKQGEQEVLLRETA